MFNIGIITASDKGSRGEREDASGRLIATMLQELGQIRSYKVVADDAEQISREMVIMADQLGVDLILTTGGTGFAPRDVTPEATRTVIEREAPGLAEAMRAASLRVTPHAMLSRGIAGIRGRALIVNLPGSPKAVRENLEPVLPALEHGLQMLLGTKNECASEPKAHV